MRPAGRILVASALAALAVAGAHAGTTAVDAAGNVHAVEVVAWSGDGRLGGTALRYVVQDADGATRTETVPGTADLAVDREPALALDPIDERPVIVWSRADGPDYDVRLIRLEPGGWGVPVPVATGAGDQVEPQLSVRANLVHVLWNRRAPNGADVPRRAALWRDTLATAVAPEDLPRATDGAISPDGGPDPDPGSATWGLSYFASEVSSGGGGGAIVVWGIRDEPLPITYVQAFEIPNGVSGARDAGAGWCAGRLMTWFVAGGSLHYSVRENGEWSDFRQIALDGDTGVRDAIDLVEQMIRRSRERAAAE